MLNNFLGSHMTLEYGVDEEGKEILLLTGPEGPSVGSTRQVMMEWEKPYMEACVEALRIQNNDKVKYSSIILLEE